MLFSFFFARLLLSLSSPFPLVCLCCPLSFLACERAGGMGGGASGQLVSLQPRAKKNQKGRGGGRREETDT